jgi:hypothetical protein
MSVPALRRVMALSAIELDPGLAFAFYELLLRIPLHLPVRDGQPLAIAGPGGQLAIPVFLDGEALARWGGTAVQRVSRPVQEVARLALDRPDLWLVVDPGSTPGGQPIARAGVEALAQSTSPVADTYAGPVRAVAEIDRALRSGLLRRELLQELRDERLFTIGTVVPAEGTDPTAAVFRSSGTNLLGVRDSNDVPYLPAWATPGAMFAYQPDLPRSLTLGLGHFLDNARMLDRGVVFDPDGMPVVLPPGLVAVLWG